MKYLFISLLLLMSVNAYAISHDRGGYGVLAIGHGYNNFSASNFTNRPLSKDTTWTWSVRVATGYTIDNYFGVELGYRQFLPQTFKHLANTSIDGTVNESAVTLQTVIRVPLTNTLQLLGKFGPGLVTVEQSVNGKNNAIISHHLNSWQSVYGVSADYTPSTTSDLSYLISYTAIQGEHNHYLPDSHMFLLGLIFHFS